MDEAAVTKAVLLLINNARKESGAGQLESHDGASEVAADYASVMATDEFVGNVSLESEPPYERYFMAGVTSFASENVGGVDAPKGGSPFKLDQATLEKLAVQTFKDQFLLDEEAKRRMVAPWLTHVGIGVQLTEGCFRMTHAYCAWHLEVQEVAENWSKDGAIISGKVISKTHKVYGAALYGETNPRAMLTPAEASALPRMPLCGRKVSEVCASDITVNEDGKFSFPLVIDTRLPMGFYVLHVYVADWKQKDVLYGGDEDPQAHLPDEHSCVAESIVLVHPYGLPPMAPITGVWIVSDDPVPSTNEDDAATKKQRAVDEDLAPAMVMPPGAVCRSFRAPPEGYAAPRMKFGYERDTELHSLTPAICELILVSGKNPQQNPPNGFDLIPVNLTPGATGGSDGPNKAVYTYLCTRSIEPLPETEVITEILLSWGPAPKGYEALPLPCGDGGGETKTDGEAKAAGGALMPHLCYRKTVVEEDLSASDREAEESRMADLARERADLAAQRENMLLLRDELSQLKTSNEQLTTRLAIVMSRREEMKDHASGGGAGRSAAEKNKTNTMETERRYLRNLQQWADVRASLEASTHEGNKQAMELQLRLDDKEAKGNEIEESFGDFKREISLGAENSRTGKPISRKIIRQFELAEKRKDEDVEKVRITNIKYRMQLRKLEKALKEKEQLAEGLHLIDFEQLKIENQTLNEKIEERNEELHKFRKKTTTTVQVLTHIKEKLQFVGVERQLLQKDLAALDERMSSAREALNKLKHERDTLHLEHERLNSQQGFASSALLVHDFEKRKRSIEQLEQQIEEFKQNHSGLLQAQTLRTQAFAETN